MSDIIEKYGLFVKEQAEHQERAAEKARSKGDEKRAAAYQARASTFKALLEDLKNEKASATQTSHAVEAAFRLTADDIKDLPPELLAQLSLTDSDHKEFTIAEVINELGGATSLDKILIGLYRKTGEIEKRNKLNSRLYRMVNKGMVYSHPSRKGVYGTRPFSEDEILAEDLLVDPEDEQESLDL